MPDKIRADMRASTYRAEYWRANNAWPDTLGTYEADVTDVSSFVKLVSFELLHHHQVFD